MDPITQQTASTPITPSSSAVPMPAEMKVPVEHKKVGPIITVLVIVLILIIGALYLFATNINQNGDDPAYQDSARAQESVQPVTNQSDDVQSLEADLDASTQGLDGQNF